MDIVISGSVKVTHSQKWQHKHGDCNTGVSERLYALFVLFSPVTVFKVEAFCFTRYLFIYQRCAYHKDLYFLWLPGIIYVLNIWYPGACFSLISFKNWMHFFVVLLACKSLDRSTFCIKCTSASYKKCASVYAFTHL